MKIKVVTEEAIQICDLELEQLAMVTDPQSDWDDDLIIIMREYHTPGNTFAVNLSKNYVCPSIDIEHFNCVPVQKRTKIEIEVE